MSSIQHFWCLLTRFADTFRGVLIIAESVDPTGGVVQTHTAQTRVLQLTVVPDISCITSAKTPNKVAG